MLRNKHIVQLLLLVGLVAAASVAASPIYNQIQALLAESTYRQGDETARRTVLRKLGKLDTFRSRCVLRLALNDPDRRVRSAAAVAIFAGGMEDLADDLWATQQREPDSRTREQMILSWAQMVGPAAREPVQVLLTSPDEYVRLGATRALVRLGDVTAADSLFAFAADSDRSLRYNAQRDLLSLSSAMGDMIGQPIDPPADTAGQWQATDLTDLQAWWAQHVTARLLQDYLTWRYEKTEYWRKVHSLLHEWHTLAPNFLRSDEEEP